MDALNTSTSARDEAGASREVFALTDEQIVGLGDEGTGAEVVPSNREQVRASQDPSAAGAQSAPSARDDRGASEDGRSEDRPLHEEAPGWLAERMKDPWHGEEAKEFWEGKQRAEKEAAEYHEVFARVEDARALKEIYPGGVSEAKAAAERARELSEIDAAFYRGDAAARMALAQRMMEVDPRAFREMVEAGVRVLGNGARDQRPAAAGEVAREEAKSRSLAFARDDSNTKDASQDAENLPGSLRPGEAHGTQIPRSGAQTAHASGRDDSDANPDVAPEVVQAYGEFEKAANGELEKSVGGAIARAMEQALPNLRQAATRERNGGGVNPPLQERLAGAVREEVEAALKSDRQLGEQVTKILAGRRFDVGARAQVVRLIDARAQQLVPGAVKRVVGAWTQATLAARGKKDTATVGEVGRPEERAQVQKPAFAKATAGKPNLGQPVSARTQGASRGRRIDYGRVSDEEILGL